MAAIGGGVLALGAWFGNVHESRILFSIATFALASGAGLWLICVTKLQYHYDSKEA